MTRLESNFEDKLAESLLDAAESELSGRRGNITFQFVERVHNRLRRYGERLDYRVEPIIDSFEVVGNERTDRRVSVRLAWRHEASVYMEFGTTSHTIEGDPILRFVWESRHDPPDWVKENYEQARTSGGQFRSGWVVFLPEVEVAGIEKIRQVRTALRWFRNRAIA